MTIMTWTQIITIRTYQRTYEINKRHLSLLSNLYSRALYKQCLSFQNGFLVVSMEFCRTNRNYDLVICSISHYYYYEPRFY